MILKVLKKLWSYPVSAREFLISETAIRTLIVYGTLLFQACAITGIVLFVCLIASAAWIPSALFLLGLMGIYDIRYYRDETAKHRALARNKEVADREQSATLEAAGIPEALRRQDVKA